MFEEAPEVALMAARLIEKHHTHLAEAKIAYRLRHGTWKVNGREIFGRAAKVTGVNKDLCGYDFVIILNGDRFPYMKPEIKEALVDHELSHCGAGIEDASGNPKWVIYPHDTEDFCAVIRRHGLWNESLKNLENAAGEHAQQLKLIDLNEKRGGLPLGDQAANAR